MAQEARIAVMGATGSGKSTVHARRSDIGFINLVSGSNLTVGSGLRSCTTDVEESQRFTLDNRMVTLIDTPGFDDSHRSDTDILEAISEYLAGMYGKGVTLSGVVYMYRISDVRMGGTSRRNFRIFRELCGNESLCNVLIVTNIWSSVKPGVGETREQELKTSDDLFKPVLDEGAQFVRHDGTKESAEDILRRLIRNEGTPLRIQRELVEEGKSLADTAAGTELSVQSTERINRLEGEIKQLREEISQLAERDERARNELLIELKKTQNEKGRIERDNKRLKKDDDVGQLALMLAALQMVSLHEKVDALVEKANPPKSKGWFNWW